MFIFLLLFVACEKKESPDYRTETVPKALMNVSYGADARQVMDVYLPPNRSTNTSVIIFIHGGHFVYGDKSDFTRVARYLAASGYAVANINYRLVDAQGINSVPMQHKESVIKVKDQVADVSAAVDFVRSHAWDWVVSSRRVGIAGHSAGGTLALLYGYDKRNDHKVQAISNIAGALDLLYTDLPGWGGLPGHVLETGFRYTGFDVETANEQHFKDISPMHVANKDKRIATLNVFPEYNNVEGLPKQDVFTYHKFSESLNRLKVPNEFLLVPGADHDISKETDWIIVLEKTVSYFNKHIK